MIPELITEQQLINDENTYNREYLKDAISCTVTEELNGVYELEMEYPLTSFFGRGNRIELGMYIVAIPSPSRKKQVFKIYKISAESGSGVQHIYAKHISYEMTYISVAPFTGTYGLDYFTGPILDDVIGGSKLGVSIVTTIDIYDPGNEQYQTNFVSNVFTNLRDLLCGPDTSMVVFYGVDVEWDNLTCRILSHRGNETPRENVNIGETTSDEDNENVVTEVVAYWQGQGTGEDDTPVQVYASAYLSNFGSVEESTGPRSVLLDLSGEFEEQPTSEQLQTALNQYCSENFGDLTKSSVSTQVSINLASVDASSFDLGDSIYVTPARGNFFGRQVARVIGIKTDVLKERYEEVTLDTEPANIVSTIVDQSNSISSMKTVENELVGSQLRLSGPASVESLKCTGNAQVGGSVTSNAGVVAANAYGFYGKDTSGSNVKILSITGSNNVVLGVQDLPLYLWGSLISAPALIQSGTTGAVSVAAQSYTDVTITFSQAFPGTPCVVATLGNTASESQNMGQVNPIVFQRSSTGATIRIFNTASGLVNVFVHWQATYQA